MAGTALNRAAMNSINAFLQEVLATEKRAAEAHTEPGSIGGETTHPVKDVDDGTEEASEGARSAENEADVKADQGAPSVNNLKDNVAAKKAVDGKSESGGFNPPGTATEDQLQIGTKKAPTGEDPAVETSSAKAEKEDASGGELGNTTHPARTNNSELDGNKYASMSYEKLAAEVTRLGNELLANIATFQQKEAELSGAQEKLDVNNNGKIEGSDLAALRKGKEGDKEPENKEAADIAGQLGWELAGLFANQQDKQAADTVVQASLEEMLKTALDDAERVAAYVYSFQQEDNRLAKRAEDPAAAMGGAPPMDPAAAMGGAPPEGGGGEEDMVAQIEALCQQLGVSPEELLQMLSEQEAGGGEAPPSEEETAGAAPGMEVAAAAKPAVSKKAAAKKGASSQAVLEYVQEVLARSK